MFGIEGTAAWQPQKPLMQKSKGNDFGGEQASACDQYAGSDDQFIFTFVSEHYLGHRAFCQRRGEG